MDVRDDGLELSLSLKCPEKPPPPPPPPPPPLNLMHSPNFPFIHHRLHQPKPSFTATFPSSSDLNAETRSYLRGIDVNRQAIMAECDEEVVVSSPNSTVSSVSGKRSEREENETDMDSSSRVISDEDNGGGEAAAKKKLRLSKEQSTVLEETFKENNNLNPKQKLALAKQLNLRTRQVEVWFQNRRARTKLKQTEVDCDHLKRCCENLTEENKRLQKEVNELRALKLSPQFYMNNPPTTLTMCPQCERVASSSTSSSSAAASSAFPTTGVANGRHNHSVGPNHQRPAPINTWATSIPH